MTYTCPVCGYPELAQPPTAGCGPYSCPSCDFRFGVTGAEDEFEHFFWRAQWVADGMPWSNDSAERPSGWDPERQLRTMLEQRYPTPAGPFTCPVCGYPDLKEPPRPAAGSGSNEICPSCGFEFGFTDEAQGFSDEGWRAEWIAKGMPWRDGGIHAPPAGWDPKRQLETILGDN
jgi:transcription elongation factor Elf1